jgi:predicted ATPase
MKFQIDTGWIVITGAPSSGKTSVIDVLAARGYATKGEAARIVIEKHLAQDDTLADIRSPDRVVAFQHEILAMKLETEAALDPAQTVFLDRGVPDTLSYLKLAGQKTEAARAACFRFRYRQVFIFDRLPVVADKVRSEDDFAAAQLDIEIEKDYRAIGYDTQRVPVLPVAKRADFILDFLKMS